MFNHILVTPRKGKLSIEALFTTSAAGVQLAVANPHRKTITFQNQAASGGSAALITSVNLKGGTTGYQLAPGATLTDDATDIEWWGTGPSVPIWVIEVS